MNAISWECKDLNGHSKVIFNALEDVIEEISTKFFNTNGYDIKRYIQDIVRFWFPNSTSFYQYNILHGNSNAN